MVYAGVYTYSDTHEQIIPIISEETSDRQQLLYIAPKISCYNKPLIICCLGFVYLSFRYMWWLSSRNQGGIYTTLNIGQPMKTAIGK